MRDLGREELQEAVQLVGVAAERGREAAGPRLGGLDRADLELQAVAEALDAPEHAHGVALGEAPVEQLDVAPDARLDPAARVDELEREVRRRPRFFDRVRRSFLATAMTPSTVRGSGAKLGDRGHAAESRPRGALAMSPRWPTSSRSARSATALPPGPLDRLVAPPYDVISPTSAWSCSPAARTTSSA